MTKFLTWSLHAPNDYTFPTYKKLADGANWNDNNYVDVDLTAPETNSQWDYRKTGFIRMIEKYTEKFYAMGLHEYEVGPDGRIYMTSSETFTQNSTDANGNVVLGTVVLNDTKDALNRYLKQSLRYLILNYPSIKWSLQFLCTTNSNGNRVEPLLDNTNGIQDVFINEVYQIMKIHLDAGFTNIKGVEIDFEKTTSRTNEHYKFRDILVRIKNEVCIPLGLELRANLFAMTDVLTPSYYAWHDYGTIASGRDMNGNQAVDEFQLMTYDFSWGGSAPGPSTPLWWLQEVLDHVKKLGDSGAWDTEDVFIGNAGYGRRWPLGEWDAVNNHDRYGTTMDYKQLIIAQNGGYIHNPGVDDPDGHYYFNDQDYIPIAGFNDDESSYQRTYLNVYDRFKMIDNGGASFNNVNLGTDYGTTYSRRQYPIFDGVAGYDFIGANNLNLTSEGGPNNGNGNGDWFSRYNSLGADTLYVAGRTTGIDLSGVQYGYATRPAGTAPSVDGEVTYTIDATGDYHLIALVYYPFFDKADINFSFNGTSGYHCNYFGQEWYPFMQTQEKHFVDLGVFSFSGTNTIQVGLTNGAQIWGFIACSSFDYNIRGGDTTFPTVCYPMKRRDTVQSDGTVILKDAQYPDYLRIVGELLLRSPRPVIIWEDVFGSWAIGTDLTSSGFHYYNRVDDTKGDYGFTVNSWTVQDAVDSTDVQHAYIDSRGTSSQFVLNNMFSSNIAVDVSLAGNAEDTQAVYGIRALATSKAAGNGYVCVADFGNKEVRIDYEQIGQPTVNVYKTAMSSTLHDSIADELRFRVYVFNGKISFWIGDVAYFDRKDMPYQPGAGAYGVYVSNSRLSMYKYNVSCMDRYERMERVEVIVDGQTYTFGDVPRNCSIDTWDFLEYSGYPAEISATVADTQNPDGSGSSTGGQTLTNTVLDTQQDPNYPWSLDYHNKELTHIPSWQGPKDIIVRFRDAGIWFRNFYVGDHQGMSVAYNGDRTAFIRTANLVNDFNCKGIGMWTLGQEDPTIYPYISG